MEAWFISEDIVTRCGTRIEQRFPETSFDLTVWYLPGPCMTDAGFSEAALRGLQVSE